MALRQLAPLTPPVLRNTFRMEGAAGTASGHTDEGDEFQDAKDEQQHSLPTDLHSAFEDCDVAIRKFFNNDLQGAMSLMRHWETTSLYHSLGTAIFQFIPAMLTFDHLQINRTLRSLKVAMSICNRHRRSFTFVESIGTIIKKPNYATYTDLEAHAELCYAEALLLQAAMTVMEGEDFTGFVKGTIKVKNCFNTYKECAKIGEKKLWESEQSKLHFQSGVRLGIAIFNVMISLLPPRLISVLEFVGFSGNKALGLAELEAGSKDPGLRSVLCDLTLLGYHLVLCHFIGATNDLTVCENILQNQLNNYPESVWFILFKGRLDLMHGKFDGALSTYQRAVSSPNQWQQFRHVCFWEIMWVNNLKMNYREASHYAGMLMDQNSWSKTIYSYCKAALMLHLNDELTNAEKQHCKELMGNAPLYKQRIAGKSLPMEKFVIKRCERFAAQGNKLVLPAVELLCMWNMFQILVKNERQVQSTLRLIERTRESMEKPGDVWMGSFAADNLALVRFMHGSLLAAMELPRLALDALNSVFKLKGDIKEDTFLLPFAMTEMAMCHFKMGNKERALQMLHEARKKYSGYSLESRLHFRLHSKIDIVKSAIAAANA